MGIDFRKTLAKLWLASLAKGRALPVKGVTFFGGDFPEDFLPEDARALRTAYP